MYVFYFDLNMTCSFYESFSEVYRGVIAFSVFLMSIYLSSIIVLAIWSWIPWFSLPISIFFFNWTKVPYRLCKSSKIMCFPLLSYDILASVREIDCSFKNLIYEELFLPTKIYFSATKLTATHKFELTSFYCKNSRTMKGDWRFNTSYSD